MRAEFNGEVKRVVFLLSRNNTLISRRGIEEEILKTPEEFPNLSKLSKPSMRCIISRVMNEFYPRWDEGEKPSRNSFVWDITRLKRRRR
jgi:hypothetical protein